MFAVVSRRRARPRAPGWRARRRAARRLAPHVGLAARGVARNCSRSIGGMPRAARDRSRSARSSLRMPSWSSPADARIPATGERLAAIASSRSSASALEELRAAAWSMAAETICRRSSGRSVVSATAPPQVDAGVLEALDVLLVHGLAREAEGLGDLRPGPPVAQGALDRGVFELLQEFPQRDDGRQTVSRATDGAGRIRSHISNLCCL